MQRIIDCNKKSEVTKKGLTALHVTLTEICHNLFGPTSKPTLGAREGTEVLLEGVNYDFDIL